MSKDILQKIWSERNPQHEKNADTGKDMFFDTVMMVIKDYNNSCKEVQLKELFSNLSDDERLEIMNDYCAYCGKDENKYGKCYCAPCYDE